VERGRVVRHHCFLAIPGTRGKLIVSDLASAQHLLNACLGPLRIGEVVLERRADQLIARATGECLHLFVDVGDDAGGIGGHQRVDVGFGERAGVELLIAQALIELLLLGFYLFARGIIGADQQIADDSAKIIAQRCNRHDRRKAAAIFTDVSQLVNVFDTARGLEDQRLEARRNRGCQLEAQCSMLWRARPLPADRKYRRG